MPLREKGKLIVFEGIDSSGKTSQAAQLIDFFQRNGRNVDLIKFPQYQQKIGILIKEYLEGKLGKKEFIPPEAIALLYAADRYFYSREIASKLTQGRIVLIDRYTASNLAHQGARFADPAERKKFLSWLKKVEGRLPDHVITVFLDVPLEISQNLMEKKAQPKDIHERDLKYLKSTLEIYRELAKSQSWIRIDCAPNGRLLSIEEIHQLVLKQLTKKMKLN